MDKFKKGFKAFKSGIKLKKKKKDKDAASIGGASQASAAGGDADSVASEVFDTPPRKGASKLTPTTASKSSTPSKASPRNLAETIEQNRLIQQQRQQQPSKSLASRPSPFGSTAARGATAAAADDDVSSDSESIDSDDGDDDDDERGSAATANVREGTKPASLGVSYGVRLSKGNEPIERLDNEEGADDDDLGSWPDTDTGSELDLSSGNKTAPKPLVGGSTGDKKAQTLDTGSTWSDSESEKLDKPTPLIKPTAAHRPTSIRSDSESAWTDTDIEDDKEKPVSPLPSTNTQAKPAPTFQISIKSDSESNWSDNESHKVPAADIKPTTASAELTKSRESVRSESESAWSDENDNDHLEDLLGAGSKGSAPAVTVPPPPAPAVTVSPSPATGKQEESEWSDEDTHEPQQPATTGTLNLKADQSGDAKASQPEESSWSEEDVVKEPIKSSGEPVLLKPKQSADKGDELRTSVQTSSQWSEDGDEVDTPANQVPHVTKQPTNQASGVAQQSVKQASLDLHDDEEDSVWSEPISTEISKPSNQKAANFPKDATLTGSESDSLSAHGPGGGGDRVTDKTKEWQDKHNQAQKEIFLLKQELEELRGRSQTTETELKSDLEKYKADSHRLSEKYETENSEKAELQSKNSQLQETVVQLKERIQLLKQATDTNSDLATELEKSSAANTKLQATIDSLNNEVTTLKENHKEALSKLFDDSSAKEQDLRKKLRDQLDEYRTLTNDLDHLKVDHEASQRKLEDTCLALKQVQAKLTTEQAAKNKLEERINGELQSEKEQREQAIAKLQKDGASLESLTAQLVQERREIENLRGQLEKQLQTNTQLISDIDIEKEQSLKYKEEKNKLSDQLMTEKREKDKLNSQLREAKSENEMLSREVQDLKNRQTKIVQDHEQMVRQKRQSEVSSDSERIQLLEAKNRKLLSELAAIQSSATEANNGGLQDLAARTRDIQLRRERAERELQEARERQRLRLNSAGSLSSCESTPRRISSPVGTADISSSSSDDEEPGFISSVTASNGRGKDMSVDIHSEKITQLKRENGDLQAQVTSLQGENSTLSFKVKDGSDQLANLKTQVEKMEEKLRLRDKEVTMELHQKLEANMAAQATTNQQKQQIILLESEVSQLREELSLHENRNSQLQAELKVKDEAMRAENRGTAERGVLDAELISARTELELLRKRSEDDRSALMSALEEKDREVTHEQHERELMKEALDEVSRQLFSYRDELSRTIGADIHNETIHKQQDTIDTLKHETTELKNELSSLSKDLANAKEVVTMQQAVLQQKDKDISERTKELDKLARQVPTLESLAREAPQLKTELKNYQDRLQEVNQEYMDLLKKASKNEAQWHEAERLNTELQREVAQAREDARNVLLDRAKQDNGPSGIEQLSVQYKHDFEWFRQSQGAVIDKLNKDNEDLKHQLLRMQDMEKEKVKLEGNLLVTSNKLESELKKRSELKVELENERVRSVNAQSRLVQVEPQLEQRAKRCDELNNENSQLKSRCEVLQKDVDSMRESRHEVNAANSSLSAENSALREQVADMRHQIEHATARISDYNLSKEELDTAIAAAKVTTDVSNLTKKEAQEEVYMERKHKMILYKQLQQLKKDVADKNSQLEHSAKLEDKLKNKIMKLKSEIIVLNDRLKDRRNQLQEFGYQSMQLNGSLNQVDQFQREVTELQAKLNLTNKELSDSLRKSKSHKHDAGYFQTKCEDLERQVVQLNAKLNDSLAMLKASEHTKSDLRSHVKDLTARLHDAENHEEKSDDLYNSLETKHDNMVKSLLNENQKLKDEVRSMRSSERIYRMQTELEDLKKSVSPPASPVASRSVTGTINHTLPTRQLASSGIRRTEGERQHLVEAAWNMIDRLKDRYGPNTDVSPHRLRSSVQHNLDKSYQLHSSRLRTSK